MILLLSLSLIVLSYLCYKIDKSIFAPCVLCSGIWGIILFLYVILDPPFYPLREKFITSLLIWIVGFLISAYLIGFSLNIAKREFIPINVKIWRILLFLSILSCVITSYNAIEVAITTPEHFFLALRSINTGLDENLEVRTAGILPYFNSALLILYIVELITLEHGKKMLYLLLFLNVFFAFITMAKTQFTLIFVVTVVVLYQQNRIKLKQLIIPSCFLLFFFVILQTIRMLDGDDFETSSFFNLYLFSSIVAFDNLPNDINYDGSMVFRFFYALLNTLGVKVNVNETILDFIQIADTGITTNTYTIMYPFYADFGYWGVLIFSLFYGCFYSYIYQLSKVSNFGLVIYSILVAYLILSFIGDFLFTNLSLFIQYSFYSAIIFLKTSKKYD